jgi:gluconate 2-dehydrogenase gamma chain
MKRINFIRLSVIGGLAIQIPFLNSCLKNNASPLTDKQANCLKQIQNILLPADNFGPSAKDINAFNYVLEVLNDPLYDKDQREYIISGLSKINDIAQKDKNTDFINLSSGEQDNYVQILSQDKNWGESWFSFQLSLLMEALLSDPIYGSNTDESGWKWLAHTSGYPRANNLNKYPQILNFNKSAE